MVSPIYLLIWRRDQPVAGKYKSPVVAGAMPGFPVAVTHLLGEVDTAMAPLVLIPVGQVLLVLTVAGVAYQVFAWTAVALAFQVFLTGDVVAVVRKGVVVAYQVCGRVVAGVAFQVAVAEQVHLVVKLVVAEGSLLVWEVAAVE